ncbi:hypothetical protein NLI96_g4939 [Meripilus lineatus]|uniref:Uncharacterized protein n=1 Tax=Meripilus lineatus TaxID=2056292 RepID=A0AAD5V490_9APHY|nr:hypothetical protein NLI96_g4939 [Physisporinus lineatus]
MPSNTISVFTDATSTFRNNIRRVRSGNIRDRIRPKGKENRVPVTQVTTSTTTHTHVDPAPYFLFTDDIPHIVVTNVPRQIGTDGISTDPRRWDPVGGNIVLKVEVPSTGDIWRFKVPEGATLELFRRKVETKLGYPVTFAVGTDPCVSPISSEGDFKNWVSARFDENGRNVPIKAYEVQ